MKSCNCHFQCWSDYLDCVTAQTHAHTHSFQPWLTPPTPPHWPGCQYKTCQEAITAQRHFVYIYDSIPKWLLVHGYNTRTGTHAHVHTHTHTILTLNIEIVNFSWSSNWWKTRSSLEAMTSIKVHAWNALVNVVPNFLGKGGSYMNVVDNLIQCLHTWGGGGGGVQHKYYISLFWQSLG